MPTLPQSLTLSDADMPILEAVLDAGHLTTLQLYTMLHAKRQVSNWDAMRWRVRRMVHHCLLSRHEIAGLDHSVLSIAPEGASILAGRGFCYAGPRTARQRPEGGDVISWLPSAHIAERALNYYFPLLGGATITTCPNPRQIIDYLPKVRPAFFFAVPRIWEKIKAGLEARLASAPEEARRPMEEAIAAGVERVRLVQTGRPVPADLERRVREADATFFAPIRQLLGLDRAFNVGVGAAPTPREVLEFFHALGIRLAEGWGMSETTAVGTIPPPEKIKLGTVGKPIGDIEIKIAQA